MNLLVELLHEGVVGESVMCGRSDVVLGCGGWMYPCRFLDVVDNRVLLCCSVSECKSH